MQCPDRGTWQAYIDDEVSSTEKVTLEQHAEGCPKCQQILTEISDLAMWSEDKLAQYQGLILDDDNTKENQTQITKGRDFWMTKGIKKWVAVAASVAVLAGSLTLTPVQDAVADLLSIFRVQKIETVKINPAELNQMARDIEAKVGQVDLQQFGEVQFLNTNELQTLTLAEAKNTVNFDLKEPKFIPNNFTLDEQVNVMRENTAEFKLNVEPVNAMLKSLGAKTLLPDTLSGQAFTIKTPDGVQMNYQNKDNKFFSFYQSNSPEVRVPDGVNPNELRAALLDLPILPEDLRTQLAAIEDWQHTMVIPEAEASEVVTIDGHQGIFTSSPHGGFSNLMWVDNGVIYQISGELDRDSMIKVAQSIY
ncbi:DUF4367 domain-containing protein [Peptococcaceae bacterium 1198_IL3148]